MYLACYYIDNAWISITEPEESLMSIRKIISIAPSSHRLKMAFLMIVCTMNAKNTLNNFLYSLTKREIGL